MSTASLTANYQAWLTLPANANIDQTDDAANAVHELYAGKTDAELSPAVREQIAWLETFIARWNSEQRAEDICDKWIKKLGVGFHPDTRGADYIEHCATTEVPCLSDVEAAAYDADMEALFILVSDAYEFGVEAMERAGLTS